MDIVIRSTVAFLFILLVTRIVGRRELNTLEPFDLILLVTIGDLVQQGVTQNDFSVTGLFLAVGTIAILTIIFSWLPWRFQILRPVLEGQPVILIEDGKVIERNLRRNRLTQEEIAAEARTQQVASFEEIRFAVLETSGNISFIKRS